MSASDMGGMSAHGRHHFTLEVRPSRDVAGHYTWAIRDHGKLYRRSDWPYPSEAEARAVAEAEIARLVAQR
ncbi:conserved hypothetical protein (plasmid) [Methylobacterium nodulans ORS 2060]|uniref:DUF1508 domain-containing protein n=1 Tax=Methylobacterium nodulans (strain LMG 21967 / CNCM I-2342 / ORS 2060) TaxID=460265 RepID=B8IWA0_METNO|nr:conserved hypothetical protein [Methylobacterium nodulans ORS 2060]